MTPALPASTTIAHKFGGSSLADAGRIGAVVDILLSRNEQQVVVVSAMRGVTDALIALTSAAASGANSQWQAEADALEQEHLETAKALLGADTKLVASKLEEVFAELRELSDAGDLAYPYSTREAVAS